MAKVISTIKAIITRLMFGAHGFIAIWQVTQFKKNPFYWYLSVPMLLLFFEGIFTLTIKKSQEWKWFCPSVFLYLGSVVPAIWLLELDKVEKRMREKEETFNMTMTADFKELHDLLGDKFKIPAIEVSTEMWVTLIEQFLMLILIIGRWMLPKGELTRDQLSQLLLVYIGTAADIIEFFDSFKDDKIASNPVLVILTLSIWSWSLMQFTVVLTATKARKSRLSASSVSKENENCCCNIDVWGILLNITLQDAPFLAFRLLIVVHYQVISYMNVFFTCKNSLVIMLQLYRLYVVFSENRRKAIKKSQESFELSSISIISNASMQKNNKATGKKNKIVDKNSGNPRKFAQDSEDDSENELMEEEKSKHRKSRQLQNCRKDTGYSTGSSHNSGRKEKNTDEKQRREKRSKSKSKSHQSDSEEETKKKRNKKKKEEESEESEEYSETEEKKSKKKKRSNKDAEDIKKKKKSTSKSSSKANSKNNSSESDTSTE